MTQLRFIGINEAGTELEFVDLDGRSFFVSVDAELKNALLDPVGANLEQPEQNLTAVVMSHPRFAEPVPAGRTPIKIIQARLRAGESIPEIAHDTEWDIEKIERFAGPILQERAYIIGLAIKAPSTKENGALSLGQACADRLSPLGVDLADLEWNTKRNENGRWEIKLTYPNRDGEGIARWIYDQENQSLQSFDDNARWIVGEDQPTRSVSTAPAAEVGLVSAPKLVAIRTDEPLAPNQIQNHPALSGGQKSTAPLAPKLRAAEASANSEAAKRDGVTKKIRIPSWDDIMFGGKSEKNSGKDQGDNKDER